MALTSATGGVPANNSPFEPKGEAAYRVLSYYFSVQWDWEQGLQGFREALAPFEVEPDPSELRNPPTPGMPPKYSLVDLGATDERRFAILYSGSELIRSSDANRVIEHFLWHVNSETARRTGNFLLIHAGAVSEDGRGVILPGKSGAGKTTLVSALVRDGFGYLSDELGVIDPVFRRLYPYPKALAFKNGLNGQSHVSPERIRSGAVAEDCEVALIVTLQFQSGADAEVTELSPAQAALELSRNAVNLNQYRSRGIRLLGEIAGKAPGFSLVWGDVNDAVPKLKELLA